MGSGQESRLTPVRPTVARGRPRGAVSGFRDDISAHHSEEWVHGALRRNSAAAHEAACMRHPAGRRRGGSDQHAQPLGRVGEHFQRPHDVDSALSHCKSLDFAFAVIPQAPCGARTAVGGCSVSCMYRSLAQMQTSTAPATWAAPVAVSWRAPS